MKSSEVEKNYTQWENLSKIFSSFDIETFRRVGGLNDRLASWRADENSLRYYKSLMFEFWHYLENLASNISQGQNYTVVDLLKKIPNQNIGSPVTISIENRDVSLDYLLACEEHLFLHGHLSESSNICEIGAGFGRTAHTLLCLNDVQTYTIIDIPELLKLSKCYLRRVLPEKQFKKLNFCKDTDYEMIAAQDIVINIASMQEMPKQVCLDYLNWISNNANLFFTKNMMGKYNAADMGINISCAKELDIAMKMGLITNTYSAFNNVAIVESKLNYHRYYCPQNFTLIKEQRGFGQYSSFGLALFKLKTEKVS